VPEVIAGLERPGLTAAELPGAVLACSPAAA
jgi:hypothetical protein